MVGSSTTLTSPSLPTLQWSNFLSTTIVQVALPLCEAPVNGYRPPLVVASSEIAASIRSICSSNDALESLEQIIRTDDIESLPLLASCEWRRFSAQMRTAFAF